MGKNKNNSDSDSDYNDVTNEIARRLERIKTFKSNLGRVSCTHYFMSIHILRFWRLAD